MSLSEHELYSDEIHPIDIVESIAEHYEWEFDRVGDDQIAMVVEGQWKTYSITLAWSGHDEVLRLIVTFDMDPPKARRPELFEALNAAYAVAAAERFYPAVLLATWGEEPVARAMQVAIAEAYGRA